MKSDENQKLRQQQIHWRERIEAIEKWLTDHDQDDPNAPQMMSDLRHARFRLVSITDKVEHSQRTDKVRFKALMEFPILTSHYSLNY